MQRFRILCLEDLGYLELNNIRQIINAYLEKGAPEGFNDDIMNICIDMCTGRAHLFNEDDQTAMVVNNRLELVDPKTI